MAKPTLNKLKLTSLEDKEFHYKDVEEPIVIKSYLPIGDKLDLISRVLNYSATDMKFYNPGAVDMFFKLEVVYAYTNISFTDKQKSSPSELYDKLEGSGFLETLWRQLPDEVDAILYPMMIKTVQSVYKYFNSAYSVLDALNTDYDNMDSTAQDIQNKLKDPDTLKTLKDVLTKLG